MEGMVMPTLFNQFFNDQDTSNLPDTINVHETYYPTFKELIYDAQTSGETVYIRVTEEVDPYYSRYRDWGVFIWYLTIAPANVGVTLVSIYLLYLYRMKENAIVVRASVLLILSASILRSWWCLVDPMYYQNRFYFISTITSATHLSLSCISLLLLSSFWQDLLTKWKLKKSSGFLLAKTKVILVPFAALLFLGETGSSIYRGLYNDVVSVGIATFLMLSILVVVISCSFIIKGIQILMKLREMNNDNVNKSYNKFYTTTKIMLCSGIPLLVYAIYTAFLIFMPIREPFTGPIVLFIACISTDIFQLVAYYYSFIKHVDSSRSTTNTKRKSYTTQNHVSTV
eukprot:TRINITY_DN2570_c0_g1_i1.p1 TRINITY_DN2570_c0_g1~~TRINITY_DN2570_c0_g1_i1.p1  ORF type:complete len:341 (+),score=23.37 TRINITY_DN2570_c0_g1_i1:342-1364(+)